MMLDSIKDLWVGHNLANQKQFPPESVDLIEPWVSAQKKLWWDQDLPKKQEYWKYTKFDAIANRQFEVTSPSHQSNRIYAKNNELIIEINDLSAATPWVNENQREAYPLPELFSRPGELANWGEFLKSEWPINYFSAMNRSFLFAGFAVNIAPETAKVIKIKFNLNGHREGFLPFQFWLRVGKGSSVNIEETIDGSLVNPVFLYDRLISIESNSKVNYAQLEQGSRGSAIIQNLSCFVGAGSGFNHLDVTLPSQWSRHNIDVNLNGREASAHLSGLYLNAQNFYGDHHTAIRHLSPATISRQHYKGILGGQCRSVFNGKVHIDRGAELSSSEQLNKNLLLSNKAEIDTKPELLIDNDNVKASHGATVGQLSDEEMFYLMSRGLTKQQSWELLSRAFYLDIFENFAELTLDFFKESVQSSLDHMRIADEL